MFSKLGASVKYIIKPDYLSVENILENLQNLEGYAIRPLRLRVPALHVPGLLYEVAFKLAPKKAEKLGGWGDICP